MTYNLMNREDLNYPIQVTEGINCTISVIDLLNKQIQNIVFINIMYRKFSFYKIDPPNPRFLLHQNITKNKAA